MKRSGPIRRRVPPRKRKHVKAIPEPVVKIYPDGREVCSNTPKGLEEYRRRKFEMWERDRGQCCLCGEYVPLEYATFEHFKSRGMGGGTRDDRAEKNGISHRRGNSEKGSLSLEAYVERYSLDERRRLCAER